MFGCVWSAFGLHAPAKSQTENPNAGRSHLMHMSHWGRFRFISDATGGETEKSFYLTTHGMVLQSMLRCVVNDYWGEVSENSCPTFGNVKYGNIKTRL